MDKECDRVIESGVTLTMDNLMRRRLACIKEYSY